MLPAIELSRDSAPDYILNSGIGDLLAAAAPRPAPARSPAPPSPAPARARAAVEGGSTATVAGRVTRGAARERGWGTTSKVHIRRYYEHSVFLPLGSPA